MATSRGMQQKILAYEAGELDQDEARSVEETLARDEAAAEFLRTYRHVRQIVQEDDTIAPPASAVQQARRIFQPAAAPQAPRLAWLEQLDVLAARLLFDSRLESIAVRKGQSANFVQFVFEAGEVEIEVQARRIATGDKNTAGHWRIMGQVTNMGKAAEVLLLSADEMTVVAETSTDASGMFTLEPPVSPGRYELVLRVSTEAGDRGIVIDEIALE